MNPAHQLRSVRFSYAMTSTAAPRMLPFRRRSRASLACSSRKVSDRCPDASLGGDTKEFLAIAASEIGNGSNSAFPPQDGIGNRAHRYVNAGTNNQSRLCGVTKRLRTSAPTGANRMAHPSRRVALLWNHLPMLRQCSSGESAGPGPSRPPGPLVGESKDRTPLPTGQLNNYVGRGTETIDADPLCIAGGNQRTVPINPAQSRGRLQHRYNLPAKESNSAGQPRRIPHSLHSACTR